MKYFVFFIAFFVAFPFYSMDEKTDDPNVLFDELLKELRELEAERVAKVSSLEIHLNEINQNFKIVRLRRKKLDLLLEKNEIETEIRKINSQALSKASKTRYIKGIQIIRILYEKVLGLDHHFASVRTFNEISNISNPNQYPEFEKLKNLVKENKDKKEGFDLTSILGTNTVVSVVNTFSNLLVTNLTKKEKETELQKIECILDFTMRMQNDLNTIYYETAFLQSSNDAIKIELETLFKEYTKPIAYNKTISVCRSEDDWDNLRSKLDSYIDEINTSQGPAQKRMIINLEFPIDRLIQFVGRYNSFINEGEKFYRKFEIILNSYENEEQCSSQIPIEYKKLKSDINIAIDKFNVAYRPVEINGSKMKEILYGINEFD